MYLYIFIFSVLLFFVLSPGLLLRVPPNGSKYVVAAVHALVFAGIFTFLFKYYKEFLLREGAGTRGMPKKSTTSMSTSNGGKK